MEEKADRRQRKTREAIKTALISLLAEKDLSKISAKDIAERADINRSTFYLHYTDAYSVMDSIQTESAQSIVHAAETLISLKNIKTGLYALFGSITQKLDTHPGLLAILTDGSVGFFSRIEQPLSERFTAEYLKLFPECAPAEAANTVYFAIMGLFGAYARWVKLRDCTLERFCSCMSDILENGLKL